MSGGKGSNARIPRDTSIRVNAALQGLPKALNFGVSRVPINLIWYGDFIANPQHAGGKGGAGGGKSATTGYEYFASIEASIGVGPSGGLITLWQDKNKITQTDTGTIYTENIKTVTATVPLIMAVPILGAGDIFVADQGVMRAGSPLIPNQGSNSYKVTSAGLYVFTSDVIGSTVTISAKVRQVVSQSATGFIFFSGTTTQVAWSYLTGAHPEAALAYRRLAYMAAKNLDLGTSAALPNITAEGYWIAANTVPGILDAVPADVISFILTDPVDGVLFPTVRLGDLSNYTTYTKAQNLFISPSYSSQSTANQILGDIGKYTNSEWAIVDGKLNLVPYGDAIVSGHGQTYQPPIAPIYDLDEDDFIYSSGEDPVVGTRKRQTDQYNSESFEFLDRTMDYNRNIVEAKDQARIDRFGLRKDTQQSVHMYCDIAMAQTACQLFLQRQLVANEYKFRLGWERIDLDCMDIVSLTTNQTKLKLTQKWVRIKQIEEDANGDLVFTAEEYLNGTGHPALYSSQGSTAILPNYNESPGPVNRPAIFEPPINASRSGKMEVFMAISGQTETYRGCDVFISFDNKTYTKEDTIFGPSRHGYLTTNYVVTPDPDTSGDFDVALVGYQSQMLSGTALDADLFHTICWLDNELIAYETATLLASVTHITVAGSPVSVFGNSYQLTYIRRGIYESVPEAHNAGGLFARIDDTVFSLPITAEQIGQVIYIKLLPFNKYGGGSPDISEVVPETYLITGNGWLYPLDDVSNLTFTSTNELLWTGVDSLYRPVDYEIRYGSTFASAIILGRTPLTRTTYFVAGTYWVIAHSRSPQGVDVYSEVPQSIVVTFTGPSLFTVTSLDQVAEGWPGTFSGGASHSGATLLLNSSVSQDGTYSFTGDNLILYSQDFTNPAWTLVGVSELSHIVTAPDGTNTATTYSETAAVSNHGIVESLTGISANAPYTVSAFFKQQSARSWAWMEFLDKAGVSHQSYFHLVGAGSLGSTVGIVTGPFIETAGGGWYRCGFTANAGSGGTTPTLTLAAALADGTHSYPGNS